MNPLIKADKISKKFFNPVETSILDEISFSASSEESVAILGKSGSGKSTLLHILGTLEPPTSGSLSFLGKPLSGRAINNLRSETIGFIFQSFYLLDEYTLLDNILMPARIARKNTSKNKNIYKKAIELLEEMDLINQKDLLAKFLSGGEKQRASIARALINDPAIIFADEPTGNLDDTNSEIVSNLLINGVKKKGKTLILVTHDEELSKLCDKRYLLKKQKLHSL